jgi:flagellin-like protein
MVGGPPPDERAVSPVVGVVLFVGLILVLAAVFGGIALDFGDDLRQPPPATAFTFEADLAGTNNDGIARVNIELHSGEEIDGDRLFVEDSAGNRVSWDDVWTATSPAAPAGLAHIDGKDSDCAVRPVTKGETYRLVWLSPEGRRYIVQEYTVKTAPTTGPTAHIEDPPAEPFDPSPGDDDALFDDDPDPGGLTC